MSESTELPRAYEVYQHFRGSRYLCLGVFTHTESKEQLVAYRELAKPDAVPWVRPLHMWFEEVSWRGYCGPRFTRL